MNTTALIAEDEPLLARALQSELALAWPALHISAVVGDGESAVAQALAHQPDVLFLDIRMPGLSGLETAAELADAWPAGVPFPAIVFVTAYDAYAVQAFEAQAVDYLLKPVQPERLLRAVQRVQSQLASRQAAPAGLDASLAQLRALLAGGEAPAAPRLQVIPASVGQGIRMVPISEVLVFEAADKYVRVLMANSEVLIRTPLKELLPQLDPTVFWQIHRGTVVRADAIDSVTRNEAGRLSLRLRGRPEALAVSRLYADRFRAM
ncbi:LytR/AlgR family response regulator transcription factor [Hydrogenophaga sp.]|uniref:LytR/AlgR family response regulator transcription factor n=1 Tax=Hydrogenophaga sp. TaxID=1904254 RepID=UPI003F728E8C